MNLFLILRLKLIISPDSLTNNAQQLPQTVPYLTRTVKPETNENVATINFDEELISKLILVLNPSKAQVHDRLSFCKLHMSCDSLTLSK